MKRPLCSTLAALAGLLAAAGCFAQAAPDAAASAPLTVQEVLSTRMQADLSVPTSPAFAMLGLTPTGIQRPGSVRELVSSFARGFDKNGKVKSGLALDFAPVPLLDKKQILGGTDYADSTLMQIKARTTVSLATAEADGGTQLAWGVRVGLIDKGDPGLYAGQFAKCVQNKDIFGGPPKPGANIDPPSPEQEAASKKLIADCAIPKLLPNLWAKPALYVGFGRSWYSGSGTLRDSTPAVKAYWGTYSVGRAIDSYRALLQLHAERKTDDRVADKTDPTKLLRQDSTALVARLKLGDEGWHAYADVGRNRINLAGSPTTNTRYNGLGMELRLKDDLWLQVGRSVERGLVDGSSQNRVLAGLRWGDKPLLSAPGVAPAK